MFINIDISTSQHSDARILMQDKICMPVLSKEVNTPISLDISRCAILYSETAPEYHIFINPIINSPLVSATSDEKLTNICMSISEKSLSEGWENENDAHWASFLND